ncbi:hypothetical protein SPHINGOT1_340076 [Sphingomonas sp. T1]|nr:hypothetical protein SPHINGOT1_340076 [Sphingomonas sp. T1]
MNPIKYLGSTEYRQHSHVKPSIQVDVQGCGQRVRLTLPRGIIAAILRLALRRGADAGLGRSCPRERIRALGSRG